MTRYISETGTKNYFEVPGVDWLKCVQAILVALWVPGWLPKLPSIFLGNFEKFKATVL